MARRYGEPIHVVAHHGRPVAFTWRGVNYSVQVIGTWRLATRWWAAETGAAVDRVYFRVRTADQQVFELYCELAKTAPDQAGPWVLDVCLD
ncbi:MAG TPA: DUF6504 family protein [Ktedonobacterales bacterium]|nr:DUF6504 family protein [Ktedonobacterales bacterium]